VEQGRWSLQKQAFAESGRAVFARERARKTRDVTASLRRSEMGRADQGAVWNAVSAELDAHGVASDTHAMSALYEQKRDDVEPFVASFQPQASQVGAVFASGGRILGLELFDSPAGYRSSAAKVVRSYAGDVIARETGDMQPAEESVRDFMQAILASPLELHQATGAGMHGPLRQRDARRRGADAQRPHTPHDGVRDGIAAGAGCCITHPKRYDALRARRGIRPPATTPATRRCAPARPRRGDAARRCNRRRPR
jgi:hypothetical protein